MFAYREITKDSENYSSKITTFSQSLLKKKKKNPNRFFFLNGFYFILSHGRHHLHSSDVGIQQDINGAKKDHKLNKMYPRGRKGSDRPTGVENEI